MGGVGFILATFFGLFIWMEYQHLVELRFILAGLSLMFFIGVRDDLVDLTAWQKLGAQLVATYIVVVLSDVRISSFYGFLGVYDLPLFISYSLSFFTVIVVTNAFNLIDGLDGLAGTISMITLSFLGWWFYSVEEFSFSMLSFTLSGGVLSFLIFNWHPAKLFMGDTGSLSLGFVLSVLVIHFIDTDGKLIGFEGLKFNAPISAGIALLIIPLYDTARVFLKRILNGKSPMSPDNSHVHHFLIRGGLRQTQVSILLGLISLFFIGVTMFGSRFNDHLMLPMVILLVVSLGYRLDVMTFGWLIRKTNSKRPILVSEVKDNPLQIQRIQFENKNSIIKDINKRAVIKSKIKDYSNINDN